MSAIGTFLAASTVRSHVGNWGINGPEYRDFGGLMSQVGFHNQLYTDGYEYGLHKPLRMRVFRRSIV